MGLYDELQIDAAEILAEFGQACTLKKTTDARYTPGTGAAKLVTEYTVMAALFDYGTTNVGNLLVETGDKQALVEAGVVEIKKKDTLVTANGDEWKIETVREENPAGTVVLYDLQVRK